MSKFKKVFVLLVSILSGCLTFTSCGSDPEPVPFSLSTESITLNFEKGSRAEFQISTEGEWSITKTPTFVEVSRTHGEGNATITVVARERNDGEFSKEDNIIIEVKGADPSVLSINVIQEKMQGCYAEPSNALLMSDGFAFNINCGPTTKYFYWGVYRQSSYNTKSRTEIINEISKDDSKRCEPTIDGGVFSFYKASASTQYVIVTQSYAENGAIGDFVEFPVTTKSSSNQPGANLYFSEEDESTDKNSILYYNNNYYFCWYAQMNSYCKEYYTYAAASKDKFSTYNWMISENFPKLAFYIRQEIQKNGEDHATSINSLSMGREMFFAAQIQDSWSFLSCAYGVDKYCQVITWGTNSNGELSGEINGIYWDSIDYSSSVKAHLVKSSGHNLNYGEGITEFTPAKDFANLELVRIK